MIVSPQNSFKNKNKQKNSCNSCTTKRDNSVRKNVTRV